MGWVAQLARNLAMDLDDAGAVDGVAAATLTAQSLVTMGLTTGALGEFAPPLPKHYLG